MINDILTQPVLEMLAAFQKVLSQFRVDFYLVGAVARDIHFSARPSLAPKRITLDVDIAVMVAGEEQFYNIKDALLATGDFSAHETEPIKLFFKHSIELDILPFGEIENEQRETRLRKPRLFALEVPGFMEALSAVQEIEVADGTTLKVCSLEGIVLLKLIAWDDTPARTKDVTDIDHIIDVYFDLYDMEIYQEYMAVMEMYDTSHPGYLPLVSARIIGRKIGSLLKDADSLSKRVIQIAGRRLAETWQALAEGLDEV